MQNESVLFNLTAKMPDVSTHTHTRFFWNQELHVSGVRKNSWPAGGYAPRGTARYHTHHADCTGLTQSETSEDSKEAIFSAFFSLEETDIFSTVYPLQYLLHTTLEHQTSTVDHTHTRTPAGMNVCTRTCATPPTLLHAAPGQRLLRWNKSIMWCVLQNMKNSYD